MLRAHTVVIFSCYISSKDIVLSSALKLFLGKLEAVLTWKAELIDWLAKVVVFVCHRQALYQPRVSFLTPKSSPSCHLTSPLFSQLSQSHSVFLLFVYHCFTTRWKLVSLELSNRMKINAVILSLCKFYNVFSL